MKLRRLHDGPCCRTCSNLGLQPWIDEASAACCCAPEFWWEHKDEWNDRVCECGFLYVEVPGESPESALERRRAHAAGHPTESTPDSTSIWDDSRKEREDRIIQAENTRVERLRAEQGNLDPTGDSFRKRDAERKANREKQGHGAVRRRYINKDGVVITEYEGED